MISGKSFSERCKWTVDPRYPTRQLFSYSQAVNGDWVFVNGDYLQQFRAKTPLFSPKKFHIIVHNTDRPFGFLELQMILPISIHIYAINTTVSHPVLTTIPIGFVDKQLPFLSAFHPDDCPRDIEIYANFTRTTNDSKRMACIASFDANPHVTWRSGLSISDYYSDLCRSKFVLCPEGTGIDTHRVYESLFCGATPVVLRNSLSRLYEKLPICILEKWTDPLPSFLEMRKTNFDTSAFLTDLP
jgi:hypothetical protein